MREFDKLLPDRLVEKYSADGIDRRTVMKLLASIGLAAPMSGFARDANAAVTEIRFENWGGVVSEAIRRTATATFEKQTGIKVVEGTFGMEDEVLAKAKVAKPGEYQIVVSVDGEAYKRWMDAGFGVVLDEAKIPNLRNVIPRLMDPLRKVTPNGISAVPFSYGTNGIAYNTKYISHEQAREQRENLLLDPKLKGKLSAADEFYGRMWAAALQTGQDPNDIKDVEAIWGALRQTRDLVKKFWSSGQESMDLLASEEVYVSDIWSGRAAHLIQQAPHIGYVEFSRGYCWPTNLLVLKGAPLEECQQYINVLLDPEVAVAVAEAQLYPSSLDPTKVPMTEKIKSFPTFDPTGKLEAYDFTDPFYWTEKNRTWKPIYDRLQQGF